MKRAGTLCRKPFIQLILHLIQWFVQSVYAFLEHGTVRVPSETSVPEGTAVVLVRNLIAYRNFLRSVAIAAQAKTCRMLHVSEKGSIASILLSSCIVK